MIHFSKIPLVTERKDAQGEPVPFSFKAISLKGEIIEGDDCIVTSSNNERRTRNIKYLASGEFRKLRNISFIELNGVEVTR